MIFLKFNPPAELRGIVKSFWILECESASDQVMDYSLFADNFPGLIFQFRGEKFNTKNKNGIYTPAPLCHYQGQMNTPELMTCKGSFGIIGVYFYSKATDLIFDLPATEVTNTTIDIDTLLGSEGKRMEEIIAEAANNRERLKALSNFLLRRLKRKKTTGNDVANALVQKLIEHNGNISMDRLCHYSGYSFRQMERIFKNTTGFSPKLFSRILRFKYAVKLYEQNSYSRLGELAYDSGYADQSHFIRDFNSFSGISPRLYFKGLEETAGSFVRL
ncbi:helix-turn-helix domain-containing protein [Leptobacterium flavescens]|uniref:Helix-turn-helix domain-containing protein n=1 Tax=Leptobacterium flavescens TaxID=472055 RepID=A0A6P0UMF9_9FLAO|nr:helix-turn-helix domain-containing protein [Leptobacterium flavescens]NER13640.1 helix-turn-helix domain-containing protein [Leptobacterium flavescens]